jgi:hypothetical protein
MNLIDFYLIFIIKGVVVHFVYHVGNGMLDDSLINNLFSIHAN